MSRSSSAKRPSRKSSSVKGRNLSVEVLEDRSLPSVNTISGFVFHDANNNGLFDPGELGIANSQIQLQDLNGNAVATTTTNAQGYYEFPIDLTGTMVDASLTQTISFGPTQTNFTLQGLIDQFNPTLGELQRIEILHNGSITSEIKVENFSPDSGSQISGTVSGTMTLTGPGVNSELQISGQAGSFQAAPYDGITDFAGTSGTSFGEKTASGSNTTTLTGAAMNAFVGTGQVSFTESAIATSNATGGGNLDVRIRSSGAASVTVVYHYKELVPVTPGSYKVVQVVQPPGYLDGLESKQGTVIPGTIGTDFIVVGLLDSDKPNNNFAELLPASLAGYVYWDVNDNGIFEPGESTISGVTITLTGFNSQGPVSLTTTTDAGGFYKFDNLRPGTYAITETQPTGWADGKDSIGSQGGTVGNDVFSNINLQSGVHGVNNNFGELLPETPPDPLAKNHLPFGVLPVISKSQLLNNTTSAYLDPALRAQMSFVVATTITLTGKQPDLAQTFAGVQQLQAGMSNGAFVTQLFNSDAHRAFQVASLYKNILNRAPTSQERAGMVLQLKSGVSEIELKKQLLLSAEYAQLHPNTEALVVALHRDILHQNPGTQAVQGLLLSMNNQPLNVVVSDLLASDGAIANMIDDAYRLTLRRAATATEIATWTTPIKNGTMTLDALTRRLLSSSEFYQLALHNVR